MNETNNEALRQKALQQRLILEAAKDYAIFTTDLQRRVTTWSAGAERVFGYGEADIIGQLADILFVPEDREPADGRPTAPQQEADTAIREERAEDERWHLRNDGSRIYGSGVVTPLRDEAGTITGLVKVMRDLTAQKQAEEALRESEKRFRLAIEATELGTWEWNLLTDEVYWNEQHFRLFGMEPQPNPIGPDAFFNHVHPDERERVTKLLQQTIAERGVYDTEFCAVLEDGFQRWMRGYGRIVEETDGKPSRMSGIMYDVDERRRAEDAVREANRRKDEFLALLAHELRNPLATLSNTLLMLRLTGGHEPGMNLPMATALMEREVAQLVRLVDDLLDVSRISLGKVALSFGRLDVVALVREATEAAQPQFGRASRPLTVALPAGPTYLTGDATRLRQVVSNLLSNALKFTTDGGHVWLGLNRVGNEAVLRVRDDGIGIPPHELNRIFGMFAQVDNSLTRSQGGLGLGLTLVNELVGLHGGRVEAHSAGEGGGSEFIVYLPVNETQSNGMDQTTDPQPAPNAKRRVLVIDDNRDAATTLAMLLKLLGNDAHTRNDGQAGIEAAASLLPQVAIIDISMPGLDGYQTCQRIREQPWGQALTLIALSGYGQAEDRRKSIDAGFNAHLVKPVDMNALVELLAAAPTAS